MPLPKRTAPPGSSPPPPDPWNDHEFARDYPHIYAFLHDSKYEDGSVRITGSLSLFCQLGALKASVSDKDRQLIAYPTAPTWAELFFLIEEGICNDSLDWKRPNNALPPKNIPF